MLCMILYVHIYIYTCMYMFVHIYMIIHICIDRCQICCVLQKKWSPWIIERLEKHMEKLMSNKTDETLWHSHQPNGWTPKWLRGNEQMLKLSQVIVSSFTVIFHLKYTTSTFMSSSRISICQSYIHIYNYIQLSIHSKIQPKQIGLTPVFCCQALISPSHGCCRWSSAGDLH